MSASSAGASGEAGAAGRVRARDIDRVNVRGRLDAAYEEGQLTAEEYHERSEAAGRAQTLGELRELVGDLQQSAGTADLGLPEAKQARARRRAGVYPGHVRARDADRAATSAILDAAHGDGQLSADDHRTMVELAAGARTLGDLEALTADLQRAADAPEPPRPPGARRRPWFGAAVTAAAVAAAVGMFVWVDRPAAQPAGAPAVDLGVIEPLVVPTPNLLTAEGITHFREVYRAKFGDTLVDGLDLFDEHASLTRAVPGQPNRKVEYRYRGGFEQSNSVATRETTTAVFDLAALDVAALATLIADAPTLLRVDGGTLSHLSFEPDPAFADDGAGPLVSVYVSNKFQEYGHLYATPAGVVVRSWPFQR
ncbi:DUF1707 domain-containing protein [Nocardia sp. NPDC127526]|uniref:DUF1707 SHOCT-like domain-containing protein n=1 Tax=Nocardia sp. NPDC127526 TaxID=3345393 RepID=UPI00362E8034